MRLLSRVVWSEGMHLAQHHFQAQSRWFEDLTAFTMSSVFFRPYGLVALELDAEALLNGTVSLVHARGIMPDATPFNFPQDPLPEPLEIAERFSPTHDAHRVLLVLPPWRAAKANCSTDDERDGLRYRADRHEMPDETSGGDHRAVSVARKNFRLVLQTSGSDEDCVVLPIARVRRDGAGHFVYDPDFVPPCVQIGASRRLLEILTRLVDMLDAKAQAIGVERANAGSDLAEYASREVANFWLAHAIHSAAGPLRHHLLTRTAHPERLFVELARLAGGLCTFSLDAHPRDLPLYDHDDPEAGFEALDRFIRRHLAVAIPTSAVRIPLVPGQPGFMEGRVTDRRCFHRAHWFLGVRSSAPTTYLIERVPELIKVCSAEYIGKLVQRGLPGVAMEHVPAPPAELAPRLNMTYFRLRPSGPEDPCWGWITSSAEVGVHIPASVPGGELDLVVLLEE